MSSNRFSEVEELNRLDRRFDSLLRGLNRFAQDAENPKLQSELYDYISEVSGTFSKFKETAYSYNRHIMIKRKMARIDEDIGDDRG